MDKLPKLALAVDDPHRVRELLEQGEPVTAHALIAAVQSNNFSDDENDVNLFRDTEESLALLLAKGVNPNLRLDSADDSLSGVADGWANGAPSDERDFLCSWKEMYPLYWTGMRLFIRLRREKDHLAELEKLLLAHGADPYALFRQPLRPRQPFLGFPGTFEPKNPVIDEEWDCSPIEYFESRESGEVFKYNAHRINKVAAAIAEAKERGEEYDDDGDDDYGDTYPFPPWTPEEYGVRSLIHAMLEDGAYMRPLLDLPNLDIEHRDPQGRTLFLSACRSALGADAAIDGCLHEVYWDVREAVWSHNPFPQQPSRINSPSVTAETITITQYFIHRGANILAVDNYGKNAVFQLLESHPSENWISFISHSLNIITERAPQLVNQCDSAGNSPLHAALRRLRRSVKQSYKGNFSELYGVVTHLLAIGADPKALDELGNTVLHYLADEALVTANSSENHKLLFQKFVSLGVNINIRNKAGRSVVELFVADEGRGKWETDKTLGSEVFELFERAGIILDEKYSQHQSLLDLAAAQHTTKGNQIVEYFIQKGLEPNSFNLNEKA